ncbi:MAG TPA: SgcJ/EcaC family oxidoreductase [Steroidobacteraceae bacterium]|nr:SgcJ/EcaC family oxidoreductase [Steroidobacteraceae bacterium]
MHKVTLTLIAMLAWLGSARVVAHEQVDAQAQIAALNEKIAAAMRRGDALALASFYTEDAMVLAPGQDIISGAPAIRQFWADAVTSGATGLEIATREVTNLGDLAIEVGTYVLKNDAGTMLDHGKFIVVWKRVNGEWRLHRDMFNSSVPPAPPPAPGS